MKTLFLDESGDHNLAVIDPAYPVFVLGGVIVAERRNPLLDRELELAWQHLTTRGTRYLRPTAVRERVTGLSLRRKSENIPGLQLADLVVSPIGRVVIGKPPKEDYRIVESKFRRRGPRGHIGAGLVVLPT